jgi:hypothetical protein
VTDLDDILEDSKTSVHGAFVKHSPWPTSRVFKSFQVGK